MNDSISDAHAALIQKQKRQFVRRRRKQQINRTMNHSTSTTSNTTIPLLYLTAATPSILYNANQFYIKHGFVVHSTMVTGELIMNTYIKTVHV